MNKINLEINTDPKNAQILVVDDEPTNVKLMEKILNSMGYKNVVCTMDPTQVLPLYQQTNFDLILLDLDMPVLDGFGVMEKLNAATGNKPPPILILTAQHMQSFRQRALDNGARDYVTKPFDIDELLSRVRNLLDVHIAHKIITHQNEILENKVRERTQQLHDTRLQIIHRLGRAAEYRDEETGLHIIRMSNIATILAKAAGMENYDCELLLHAAPMHDIGKIGIPDHILLKPGKLNPQEWQVMQTHAQIGADMLSGDESDLMSMAHDIALTHHEKWDGTGYPRALKGDAIPLVGRITALADVFDALTSERPYKKAWPLKKALDLIQEQSGKHFDPELAQLLFKHKNEIVAIIEEYAEPKGSIAV